MVVVESTITTNKSPFPSSWFFYYTIRKVWLLCCLPLVICAQRAQPSISITILRSVALKAQFRCNFSTNERKCLRSGALSNFLANDRNWAQFMAKLSATGCNWAQLYAILRSVLPCAVLHICWFWGGTTLGKARLDKDIKKDQDQELP